MTTVRPFRGLRYDADRVKLSDVIVPPYDVIAADERERFYQRDPHNAIRFELTRKVDDEAATDYGDVAQALAAWRASGVLLQDDEPGYYVMRQRFVAPTGQPAERIGFFGELHLEDYEARIVRPHERTLAGPKADRLKLLRASRANLSSVFLLYEDREDSLAATLEDALAHQRVGNARDDAGVEYELARICEPAAVERIRGFMEAHPVVIADGHHRYETAINYRNERRAAGDDAPDAPHESTLAFFANAMSPGSLLLPIHRVVRKSAAAAPSEMEWHSALPDWEMREEHFLDSASVQKFVEEHLAPHAGQPAFAVDDDKGLFRIFWKPVPLGDDLVVRIVEEEVLGRVFGFDTDAIRNGAVAFPKSAEQAAALVRSGEGSVAIYLNPLQPEDVFRVTARGEVMPQKSTFFYPKVPTGMVFRVYGDEDASR